MDAALEATVQATPKVDVGRRQVGGQQVRIRVLAVQRVQELVQTRRHLTPQRVGPVRQLQITRPTVSRTLNEILLVKRFLRKMDDDLVEMFEILLKFCWKQLFICSFSPEKCVKLERGLWFHEATLPWLP